MCVLFDRNVCPVVPLRSLKNNVLRSSWVRPQFQGLRMTRYLAVTPVVFSMLYKNIYKVMLDRLKKPG